MVCSSGYLLNKTVLFLNIFGWINTTVTMITAPRLCSHCRISSRKAAFKTLRKSCSQMRAIRDKWRPAKLEDESFMAIQPPTSPLLLLFKGNRKQMNLGAESCSGPLWQAVNHLPREMENSGSLNLLLLASTRLLTWGYVQDLDTRGSLYAPKRQVFILYG